MNAAIFTVLFVGFLLLLNLNRIYSKINRHLNQELSKEEIEDAKQGALLYDNYIKEQKSINKFKKLKKLKGK